MFQCGYRTDGTKRRKKKTFKLDPFLTKKQKEKQKEKIAYEFEQQVLNNKYLNGDIRFIDYSKRYMEEYAKDELSVTTYKRYETLLEKINLEIGDFKLTEIKPPHIRDLKKKFSTYTKKVPVKNEKGKTISYKEETIAPKTQLHYFRLVSSILSRAVQEDFITENPCSKVNAPKVPKKEVSLLDIETIKTMLKLLEKEPIQYRSIICFLIFVGCRRGEALAITWNDISLERNKNC
ncbi:MAG: phage integrase SAM-like domain-containing protein [Clostridia bacterium]|nr:phage integrase SAM-like domain-containing protein [Clostridia bacterium]